MAEVHVIAAVLRGIGPASDRQVPPRVRYLQRPSLETDLAVPSHCHYVVVRSVLDRRQHGREWPLAGAVARQGNGHADPLMRTLLVVDGTPAVKRFLRLLQVFKAASIEHLGFQCAMESLELAIGLRMMRPAVAHPYAQAQQPDAQLGQAVFRRTRAAPGRTIVGIDTHRQAITAK